VTPPEHTDGDRPEDETTQHATVLADVQDEETGGSTEKLATPAGESAADTDTADTPAEPDRTAEVDTSSVAPPPWQRGGGDQNGAAPTSSATVRQDKGKPAPPEPAAPKTPSVEDTIATRRPAPPAEPAERPTQRTSPPSPPHEAAPSAATATHQAPVQGFVADPGTAHVAPPQHTPAAPSTQSLESETIASRTMVNLGSGAKVRPGNAPTPNPLRRPGRGPRRASLQLKRVDPWSVLKLAFVLSIALFFVWLVAVGVLYGVLDGMGVWDKINGTLSDLVQGSNSGSGPLISAGRVFGIAAILGAINIVLFTALATVGAFIYNVAADLAGGLEITLAERE